MKTKLLSFLILCFFLAGVHLSSAAQVTLPQNTGLATGNVQTILTNVLSWLLGIVGVVGLISFAIAGMQYLTSMGEDSKMQTAKKNMMYAVIGIVAALSGFIIIQAINTILGGSSTNF